MKEIAVASVFVLVMAMVIRAATERGCEAVRGSSLSLDTLVELRNLEMTREVRDELQEEQVCLLHDIPYACRREHDLSR